MKWSIPWARASFLLLGMLPVVLVGILEPTPNLLPDMLRVLAVALTLTAVFLGLFRIVSYLPGDLYSWLASFFRTCFLAALVAVIAALLVEHTLPIAVELGVVCVTLVCGVTVLRAYWMLPVEKHAVNHWENGI